MFLTHCLNWPDSVQFSSSTFLGWVFMVATTQTEVISSRSSWRGSLLVTGTCIGGGMLAMPIQTAEAGFVLSLLVLFVTWVFMTFTGLLLVEVSGWFKNGAHFSSMAQNLLGKPGNTLSLVVYLFMNCASLVAYTSAGALLIDHWAQNLFGISPGYVMSCVLFTVVFGGIVSLGISFIGRMNAWMTIFMGAIYCYIIVMGISYLKLDYLAFRPAWMHGLNSFPLIIAAFSYQMIVPSLCSYLNYDVKDLKKSIVIGTSLPFVVYFLWLLVIHGIIPFEGALGLREASAKGLMIVEPLKAYFNTTSFFFLIDTFAFLAVATSYMGLSVALFDFVKDLLRNFSQRVNENKITFLSLVPSMTLAIFFPKALLDFLDMSGGFGDALLSGLIPIGMIWVGRYKRKIDSDYQMPGGKLALVLAGSFAFSIFVFQWVKLIWKV